MEKIRMNCTAAWDKTFSRRRTGFCILDTCRAVAYNGVYRMYGVIL